MQLPFLQKLVDALANERVRFVVIGGVASTFRAAGRPKDLLDLGNIAELRKRRG